MDRNAHVVFQCAQHDLDACVLIVITALDGAQGRTRSQQRHASARDDALFPPRRALSATRPQRVPSSLSFRLLSQRLLPVLRKEATRLLEKK